MQGQQDEEFDIIFCGGKCVSDHVLSLVTKVTVEGGTAACVAASRLSASDPKLKILLIEHGDTNLDNPAITTPYLAFLNLLPGSKFAINYKGTANQYANSRGYGATTGGTLGGGGSVNLMYYGRPERTEYDGWNVEGWDHQSLLPLFKKVKSVPGPLAVIENSLRSV